MRKVKPENEIEVQVFETDQELIEHTNVKFDVKDEKRVHALFKYFENLAGGDVDINTLMKRICKELDLYMSKHVYPVASCAKGCGHCCKVPVLVSSIEASYISNNTDYKIKLADNLPTEQGYIVRMEALHDGNSYCPLFDQKTATCGVYEYRPIACRTYASFEPWQFCEDPTNIHAMHNSSCQPWLKHIDGFMITQAKAQSDNNREIPVILDIREWFSGEQTQAG